MNLKKELTSWAIILGIFGVLYFTGWITPIMGKVQSIVLSTGLIKPKIEVPDKANEKFDYVGRFKDLEGQLINLEDYKGQTLFINLWATWCPPCRAEMPHIASLYQKVKDQENLAFLMIALDKDIEKSKKFIDDKGYSFPVVHASYGLNASLQSQSIPTTLVINKEGQVVFYQEGMSNFDTDDFRDFLLNQ